MTARTPQVVQTLSTLQYLFEITTNEFLRIRRKYRTQCPCIWEQGMDIEDGFLYAVAIGEKFKFPYLRYLVDDYLCEKARRSKYGDGLSVHEWALKSLHFEALREQKVRVHLEWNDSYIADVDGDVAMKNGQNPQRKKIEKQSINQSAAELMEGAVKSWTARCVHHWKQTHLRIDDSMEAAVRYLHSTVRWVHTVVENYSNRHRQNACPFQVDLCLVFDQPDEISMCTVTECGCTLSTFDDCFSSKMCAF